MSLTESRIPVMILPQALAIIGADTPSFYHLRLIMEVVSHFNINMIIFTRNYHIDDKAVLTTEINRYIN